MIFSKGHTNPVPGGSRGLYQMPHPSQLLRSGWCPSPVSVHLGVFFVEGFTGGPNQQSHWSHGGVARIPKRRGTRVGWSAGHGPGEPLGCELRPTRRGATPSATRSEGTPRAARALERALSASCLFCCFPRGVRGFLVMVLSDGVCFFFLFLFFPQIAESFRGANF